MTTWHVMLVIGLVSCAGLASAAPPQDPHDLEGTIVLGDGNVRLARGMDHFIADAITDDVTGFRYTGDIRYETTYFSFGPHLYHRVTIMAPLGSTDVGFTFDWVRGQATPQVPLPTDDARPTNCTDALCLL